jgi:hypothetical protein
MRTGFINDFRETRHESKNSDDQSVNPLLQHVICILSVGHRGDHCLGLAN